MEATDYRNKTVTEMDRHLFIINILITKCLTKKTLNMKMRFFAAAIAATALLAASCTKERTQQGTSIDPQTGKAIVEGTQTYACFNFRITSGTRASMLNDAGEPSNASMPVKSLRLLIFRNSTTSTACEYNQDVPITGMKMNNGVLLSSGVKRIFVIANAGTAVNALLNSITVNTTTQAQFLSTISELKVGDYVASPLTDTFDIAELVGNATNGMVLSNVADDSSIQTLAPSITEAQAVSGPDNQITLTVKRVVAKGKVLYKDNSVLTTDNGLGTLSSLSYAIRNVRRSTFLVQQFRSGTDVLCPNDAVTSADYGTDYDSYRPYFFSMAEYVPAYAFDYEVGNLSPVVDDATAKAYYFTEDINGTQRWGNVTWAAVKAVFTPISGKWVSATTYDVVNKKFLTVTYGTTVVPVGTTLYVTKIDGNGLLKRAIFTNETAALQAAYSTKYPGYAWNDDAGAPVSFATFSGSKAQWEDALDEYVGGVCYYQIIFGSGNTGDNSFESGVLRNNYYKATISKFAGIGSTTETGDTDPGDPIATKTYVNVDITIEDWNIVTSDIES